MNSETIKIYGKVTDFHNKSLSGAVVRVLNDQFEDIAQTYTNDFGQFELILNKGLYFALYACKDYGVQYLEFWAWNIPAYEDIEINPRIDGLEIYSIIAFKVLHNSPQLMLYFRPMSLIKGKPLKENINVLETMQIIDIAPNLTETDIKVNINGTESKIYKINKVEEYAEKNNIYAYLIHVSLDSNTNIYEYNRIDVTIKDIETGELGEGTTFWKETSTTKDLTIL